MSRAVVAVLIASTALAADAPAPNAVQREMAALHELTLVAVTAIANDKTELIAEKLHQVHELTEQTEKAIEAGEWKPARGTVKDFVKQDKAFHGQLEKLLAASQKKDVVATTKALGAVLDGCTACHVKFRFPAK